MQTKTITDVICPIHNEHPVALYYSDKIEIKACCDDAAKLVDNDKLVKEYADKLFEDGLKNLNNAFKHRR